jgi:hypothetical protein
MYAFLYAPSFFSASGKGESGFEFPTEGGSLGSPGGLEKKNYLYVSREEKEAPEQPLGGSKGISSLLGAQTEAGVTQGVLSLIFLDLKWTI